MCHRTVWWRTGQSGALLTSALTSAAFTVHCTVPFRVDHCAQVAVAPLAHQTVRWCTGQSGEI
jgi:hypothetical protein